MSSNTVYDAVRTYLQGAWTTTPLVFENEREDNVQDAAAWVYVEASGTIYDQASIGAGSQTANRYREYGTIFLHVFVPAGTGSTTARTYAKQLADLFRGLELNAGSLVFRAISIGAGEIGDDNGKYFRVSVSADYVQDQ